MLADPNAGNRQNDSTIPEPPLEGENNYLHDATCDRLRTIIERIESVNEAKARLGDDLKEIYDEARSNGFDTKVLRTVIRIRAQDQDELQAFEGLVATYLRAVSVQGVLAL